MTNEAKRNRSRSCSAKCYPRRVQRKRVKGWQSPANTVYVGRPTKWGNPYRVNSLHPRHGWPMSQQETVNCFRESLEKFDGTLTGFLIAEITINEIQRELKGKNLSCFCTEGAPCHADVLLEIANRG